jgi:hypothetical protein
MGHKVFVSYKYGDTQVRALDRGIPTKARDYVNVLQDLFEDGVNIWKAEDDGEDLSQLDDNGIWTKLKEKIKDSSVTIVLISKGMKTYEAEESQWIPKEVSYSLKEIKRDNRISKSNGIIAVIIPDENDSYAYYLDECDHCNTTTHKTNILFQILGKNMFNQRDKTQYDADCNVRSHGKVHKNKLHSYAYQVKWDKFIKDIESHIDHAVMIRENIDDYEIQKSVLVN